MSISTNPGREPQAARSKDEARTIVEQLCAEQPYAKVLGYRVVDAADLAVTLALPLRPELLQPRLVHGGAISSLVEAACAFAVLTRLFPAFWVSTVEQSVQFLRPVEATTGELVAFAHVRRFGRAISFVEATVTHEGREIATARSTQIRRSR